MQTERAGCGNLRQPWLRVAVLSIVAQASAAWCQGLPAAPLPALTTDQVVQRLVERNRERACALQHYSAVRTYRLEYRGFPRSADATMVVDVKFDAPGPKRFTVVSSTGPKVIESRVFERLLESERESGDFNNRAQTELGPENYRFSLAGVDGTNYVLNAEPKVESKFLYRGKIWVDGHDFAVTRIEAQPARNPSMLTSKSLIFHTYEKVGGGFYLPRENKTITSVRLGGTATLTIDYDSYQITAAASAGASRLSVAPVEGTVWLDGGSDVALANFAGGKK